MNKKEIQEKLNNLPKPKYLYQRYNGEIRKYEIQDNILINVNNTNDIIDKNNQLILGETSERIMDLLEVHDFINNRCIEKINYCLDHIDVVFVEDMNWYGFDDELLKGCTIVTKEQFEKAKFVIDKEEE